jgi:hypothetical protein
VAVAAIAYYALLRHRRGPAWVMNGPAA